MPADVPKWPDFSLTYEDWGGGRGFWLAKTDTGRPKTPVFSLAMVAPARRSGWTEDEARAAARIELDTRYARAHPNGCG